MRTLYLLFISLFICCASFGQMVAFTGRIVDERNEPVAGSYVKIHKSGKIFDTRADMQGVFHIDNIAAGDYYADINADGRIIRSKKIYIQPEGRVRTFYNFKLYRQGVTVSIMADSRQASLTRP